MNILYDDIPSLPAEIFIPDGNYCVVEPVVQVFKPSPWFVEGTLEVGEEDWV